MDLLPTDEQAEIASTVHNALEAAFPLNDRDRFDVIGAQETLLSGERPGGGDPLIDDARWAGFGELGWFSLGLAEADGGVGYGLAEEVLLAEELGRQVAPGPFVAQIVASRLAAAAQLDAAADLAAGTLRAAWGEPVVSAEGSPAVIRDRTTADLLVQHPKVGDVAVVGLPDPSSGERACAVVQTAAGAEPIGFDEMVAFLKDAGLMVQKLPEQLEILDTIPRNASGKVLKHVLRDELKG